MWPNPGYQFEFAQPPFAWQKVRWPGVFLLTLCLVLLTTAWQSDEELTLQLQTLEQRKTQLVQRQVADKPIEKIMTTQAQASVQKKSATVLSQPQQKEAETITRQLNVRWFDLLQALEARQIKEVALLQLIPDAGRGQFALSGEAKDYTTLLKYIGHLQEEPALIQVHLQKHQVNETHPQRPVSFEIQGGWQP